MVSYQEEYMACRQISENATGHGGNVATLIFGNRKRDSCAAVSSGIFNLANTIMGASLTGLPYVVSMAGIIPYLTFMTLSVAVGYCTICFLIQSIDYLPENKKDFQLLGTTAMGQAGANFTAFATWLSCYGVMIAYFVLAGIQGPFMFELMGFENPPSPWIIQIGIALFVLLPLSCLKDISKLAPTSFVAITVFASVAFMGVYSFVTNDSFYKENHPAPIVMKPDTVGYKWFPSELTWTSMSQFPTILMAFNCQYAFLPTVENFDSKKTTDMRRVGFGGLFAAYSVYVVLGLCAYMTFAGHTMDIVLLNFRHCHDVCLPGRMDLTDPAAVCHPDDIDPRKQCEDTSAFVNALNGLFLFAVLMGYPCVHFSCRKAQIALTLGLDSGFSWNVHIGIAVFNLLATLGIAILVGTDVSLVFRWTGAVASPLLSFVLPSLFYFMLLGKAGLSITSPKRLAPLVVLCYGIFIVFFCVLCNIMDA